jgi:hypothetical protein
MLSEPYEARVFSVKMHLRVRHIQRRAGLQKREGVVRVQDALEMAQPAACRVTTGQLCGHAVHDAQKRRMQDIYRSGKG